MKYFCRRIAPVLLASSAALVIPAPDTARAETLEELDAMAEITQDEAAGIQFAQGQADRGEFLEAIGTLERVLANHPKSQAARLLHAVLLCRIDDQTGGAVELAKLKQKDFPDETWTQAKAICTFILEDTP